MRSLDTRDLVWLCIHDQFKKKIPINICSIRLIYTATKYTESIQAVTVLIIYYVPSSAVSMINQLLTDKMTSLIHFFITHLNYSRTEKHILR